MLGSVSPRRAQLHAEAGQSLQVQALVMQRQAQRRMGRLSIIGDMVQVKVPDVDPGKLDAPCLTAVIVELSCEVTGCLFS